MRLYLKLTAIVLLAVAAQWGLKRGAVSAASDAWFAARCHLAHLTNDEVMRNQLIEEARIYYHPVDTPVFVAAGAPAAESTNTADRPDSRPCSRAGSRRPCSSRP